jgi:iron complex transport system substrate-binding protein
VVLADDKAGPPEVLQQLRAAGVRIVRFAKEETIDAPARKIREVAAALGVPDRGEELVATLDVQLAAAGQRADAAVAASGRPKVLALYLRGPNVQLTFGKGSGIDAVIAAAGGTDAGTEMGVVDNAELSIESIVEEAPDVLLVTTTGLESVGGIDGLLATPGIDRTPAATNRRVVAFEDQYLYGLGPRTGELVGELVSAFHPDAPTS